MGANSYWTTALRGRASRRRTLIASGTALMGAAFLACGGGSTSGGSRSDSSLVTKPADTSKSAVRGGMLVESAVSGDTTSLDPHDTQASAITHINSFYNKFVILKAGLLTDPSGDFSGDAAESWEWSPDGLKLTMKLRQGAGMAPLPPVNGRPLDVDDIKFTYDRYLAKGNGRADYFNSLNPQAPILKLTISDPRTFTFDLAFPIAGMLALFAQTVRTLHIVPKEADTAVDIRRNPVGAGPFYLKEYANSSRFVWQRNPNYYDKVRPYLESVTLPVVTEYAAALAQLRAGGIYTYENLRGEDVLSTKQDVPALNLYENPVTSSAELVFFGWRPSPPERTPFRDERLRQAYSMSIDRDAFIEVFYNVSKFQSQGLPVETRWNSCLACDFFPGWWIDPRDKNFGPNAVYFQHNIAEAKKLIAAAGYPNGLETKATFISGAEYGQDYGKKVEVLQGMAAEAGFKFTNNGINYASDFIPNYRDARGNFDGIAYRAFSDGQPDAIERMAGQFNSQGSPNYTGFDPEGKGTREGDPALEEMIKRGRAEQDTEKRKAIAQDVQRYAAKKQYNIRFPGGASGFRLAWPAVKNYLVYRQDPRDRFYYWLDEKAAPLKKA